MVVVAIGRNTADGRPMPVARWHRFQRETADALGRLAPCRTTAHGRFEGSDTWRAEDTALYVLDGAVGSGAVQSALQTILIRYQQERALVIQGSAQEV